MRLFRNIIVGALAVAGAFALSAIDDGTVGAGALILAMFLAVITAGLVAAAAVDHWVDRPAVNPVMAAQAAAARCSSCRRTRISMGGMWACPKCDLAPVRRSRR